MAIDVLMGAARLDDEAGIETFLKETPNPDALRPILKPGEKRRIEHYDKNKRTARYLLLNGEWFVCFVVTDITLSQAQDIARQTDLLVDWSVPKFREAVGRALNLYFPPKD